MPKPTRISTNTCYTADAFVEIAEAAVVELRENCDSYEIKNLANWSRDLKRALSRVAATAGDGAGADDDRPISGEAL